MRLRALLLVLGLVGWLASPSAAATGLLDDYRITAWSGGDGITLGTVRALDRDAQGNIWIASDAGLVRFDGFRFAAADLVSGPVQLPAAPTHALHIARDGSLWVAYVNGLGVYRLGNGRVTDVHLQGQISGSVWVIAEDREGNVWVGADDGLRQWRGGAWSRVALAAIGPEPGILDVHEDRGGRLWVGTQAGLFVRDPGAGFRKYPGVDGITHSISEDPAGAIWVTDQEVGFRRVDASRPPRAAAQGMTVYHDRQGDLWVATIGQGLWRLRAEADASVVDPIQRATTQTGLISDELSAFVEDADGNLWAGSRQGLHLLRRRRVIPVTDVGVTTALTLDRDGRAWVATDSGLVSVGDVTSPARGQHSLVSRTMVRALHTARDGTVWVATNNGLQRLDGNRLVEASAAASALQQVTSLASDRSGAIWVCDTTVGLVRLSSPAFDTPVVILPPRDPGAPVLVHVDDRDRAWVALRGGGAAVVERGRVTRVPRGDGFPHSTIFTIAHDQMGRVWMGGDGGLSLLGDDGARTISSAQGLPTGRAVVGVTSDDRGDLWVGLAFFGFIRIANDELMRALDDPGTQLRPRHVYDTVDGTAGVPDYYPNSGVRSARGTLWFLTGRGLTVLEPARLRAREDAGLAPPRIEGLITGDGRYYNASGAVLPPRVSQIRIDYGAATPVSSEGVRFRYRLEGFDRDWVDAVGRRQAFYTNLPPGTYRFRLQSNEGIGAWTDDRAAWTFTIEPMFYQTYWFYAASVLALGMAAVAIWRLRSRQLRKTIEAAYGERLRIGREIHDTLLQSLVGITLQLDAAYHDATERSARLPATLLAMRRQIETYIVETRESIWNLRSASLDRDDLVGAMRAAAEKLTRGEVDLTFDVSGQPRRGRPEVETHALRIGQEAIMNAVRHARASRVRVELGFDDRHIRVTVTDNGKGFDVSQALSGDMADHYGLLTMQERAAEAGGALRIESRPGDGTTVQVELPLERERR